MDVDYVGAQNSDGGYAAAEHLYSHGCRRIAFVGGFADSSAREERAGGVEEFLNDHGLTLDSEHSVVCEPARPEAREAAMRLLTKEPDVDGIVCFSDVVAFGVLDAIADLGRSHRIGRSGDRLRRRPRCGLNRPPLTSVAVPARETGRRADHLCWNERRGRQSRPSVRSSQPS